MSEPIKTINSKRFREVLERSPAYQRFVAKWTNRRIPRRGEKGFHDYAADMRARDDASDRILSGIKRGRLCTDCYEAETFNTDRLICATCEAVRDEQAKRRAQ
jgi:hypothetical protein